MTEEAKPRKRRKKYVDEAVVITSINRLLGQIPLDRRELVLQLCQRMAADLPAPTTTKTQQLLPGVSPFGAEEEAQ